MAEFYGSSASIQWVYTSGTAQLSGNYRKVDYKPSVDLIDVTAGSDAAKLYISAQKDGQLTVSGLVDTGGTVGNIAGTAALVEGTGGTLILGPEGTAAGKPKQTFPAIAMGIQLGVSYNAATEFTITFQQNGARTDGTF
jgi:hypothetical protein